MTDSRTTTSDTGEAVNVMRTKRTLFHASSKAQEKKGLRDKTACTADQKASFARVAAARVACTVR